MATRPAFPSLPAAPRPRPSTRGSSSTPPTTKPKRRSRFNLPPASGSPHSADLAGRSVSLSVDIPATFDQPLSNHHKLIGRWVAAREGTPPRYTRVGARKRIEQVFNAAVLEILAPIELVDLRVAVLVGEDDNPPAIALVCETLGQLDLGWIETGDAPIPWRAAAYAALGETLGTALPVFGYQDLFEEISMYYWDGEIDDEGARRSLAAYQGLSAEEIEEQTLPSEMNARRPDWMIGTNAAKPACLPKTLAQALHRLRDAHKALDHLAPDRNAWHFDSDALYEYVPGIEECSSLPPLTLVPFEEFARELDDVARHGMEMGFMDFCGLCPLPEISRIDDWFASLRLGVQFLLAAQDLVRLDPPNP